MVVRRQAREEALNRLFRALADETRRDIVVRTLVSEESVSNLSARYQMSFAAVQKHVAVLERVGLVTKRPSGREQLVSGNVAAIQRASNLLDQFEAIWRGRMDRLDDLFNNESKETKSSKGK